MLDRYRDHNWFWVPWIGPYVGAIVGVFIYLLFVGLHHNPDEEEDTYGMYFTSVEINKLLRANTYCDFKLPTSIKLIQAIPFYKIVFLVNIRVT